MGRLFTDGNPASYYFSPTNASPVDSRLVVDSYNSLFSRTTWEVEGDTYLYSGMPVVVSSPYSISSEMDTKSGLYVLLRTNAIVNGNLLDGIEYLYDPDPSKARQPQKDGSVVTEPGISNMCGWLKIASMTDLKFPTPETPTKYVLKVNPTGDYEWVEYDEGSVLPEPNDTDNPTYLTATWDPVNQEYDLSWTRVTQGGPVIPDPTDPDTVLTAVPDGQGGFTLTWTEKNDSNGIKIKGYPTQTDADGRWQPGPAEPLVSKTTLSNSGEVIAVPVDSEEDQSEDNNNPDRPFKLMLNYDEIPPLTIYGGNSEPEPDTCVFTAKYYVSGGSGNPVFQDYMTGAVGSEITYNPVQTRTVGGVTYTLNSGQSAWTGTLTGTTADTATYWVTAQAAWEPVAKYAVQPSFNNYDWDSKGQPSSPTVLTETAPQGVTQESAGDNSKYFYSPSGSITLVQLSTVTNRLRIEDTNHITDLDKVDMWDDANNQWIELTQNTAISLTKTRTTAPSVLPSLSEWDFTATKAGTNPATPIFVTLRFKITKQ